MVKTNYSDRLLGFRSGGGGYPMKFQWNNLSRYFAKQIRLRDPFGGWLIAVDMKSESSYVVVNSAIWQLLIVTGIGDSVTSIHEDGEVPSAFVLHQNFPNPFNPSTVINYEVPSADHVRIAIYDIFGREIETLVDEVVSAGHHEVEWDADGIASGMYLYQIKTPNFFDVKKMVLLR